MTHGPMIFFGGAGVIIVGTTRLHNGKGKGVLLATKINKFGQGQPLPCKHITDSK